MKLTLVGMFLASIAIAGRPAVRRESAYEPVDLALMGLTSYRIGRMVAGEPGGERLGPRVQHG